jgi:hypothetical protein
MFDSTVFVIPTGKKGKNLPRFIASHAVSKFPMAFDNSNMPVGSLIGIDGEDEFPTDMLSSEEVTAIEEGDKFGDEVVDGDKLVKKKRINLKQIKENYSVNNL